MVSVDSLQFSIISMHKIYFSKEEIYFFFPKSKLLGTFYHFYLLKFFVSSPPSDFLILQFALNKI